MFGVAALLETSKRLLNFSREVLPENKKARHAAAFLSTVSALTATVAAAVKFFRKKRRLSSYVNVTHNNNEHPPYGAHKAVAFLNALPLFPTAATKSALMDALQISDEEETRRRRLHTLKHTVETIPAEHVSGVLSAFREAFVKEDHDDDTAAAPPSSSPSSKCI